MAAEISPDFRNDALARLYVRGFASIAALSCVRNRSQDERLLQLLENYLAAAKSQLRRLQCAAGLTTIDRTAFGNAGDIDELQDFARDIARGQLSGQFDSAAASALHRLAVGKHARYEQALFALPEDAGEASFALTACLAEEAAAIESLEVYQTAASRERPLPRSA